MILLLIIGIGAFAYPFVSDALNNYLINKLSLIIKQKQAKKTPKKWLNFKKNGKENQELAKKAAILD